MQEVISQKIRRTCQGCDIAKEYELVGVAEEAVLEDMFGWYTIVREILDPQTGRAMKIMTQACCLACVPAAAVKLALPKREEEPEIDLKSLRNEPPNSSVN